MTREDRIGAALVGGEVGRLPCSVWMHLSKVDQGPKPLAEGMVSQNERYGLDFIKMMPSGVYFTQDRGAKIKIYCDRYKEPVITGPGIRELGGYGVVQSLAVTHKTWGKTLQVTRYPSEIAPKHTSCLQTIFNPVITLKRLTSNRLIRDMVGYPEEIHKMLRTTTDTTINFVQASTEAGASGFSSAIQTATYDFMTDILYAEFCKPHDLEVVNSYKDKTWLNMIHIHGSNIMYNMVSKYPCNCTNWHDRDARPDVKTVRETAKKTFLGGIQKILNIISGVLDYDSFLRWSIPQQVIGRVKQAIAMADGKGLIIELGCVCDPGTLEENLHVARRAAEF